jgi:tetratricopeptide (TPR) repeat protein/tRNA A-37 threonylcarbamoyl transferase component Bud32
MKCPRCGAKNAKDLVECAACGEVLLDVQEETAVDHSLSGSKADTAGSPGELATEVIPRQKTPTGAGSGSGSSGRSSSWSSATSRTGPLPVSTLVGGRYEIQSILGEGGMGVVYKALDRELDKVIALKTIRGEKSDDAEILQRFKQELLLARKITHKNVVRIYDFGDAEGMKYFTMEYVEGESLKRTIRNQGRIAPETAVSIIRQVLSALKEAHAEGVVHRDLKPQNIMMDKDGTPKIMDFGIARSVAETSGMTATGAIVGTPDYMSPEQVRGEKADEQSDLFSIGVILYEMLTGEVPFKGDSPMSKVMMRLTQRPRAPREIHVDIPGFLEGVVFKSMEVDRALRYKSAEEMALDLERQQVDRSLTLRVQRAVSRQKWLAVAGLAALAAGGAFLWTRGWSTSPAADVVEGPVRKLAILPLTNAAGTAELDWLRTGLPEMLVTDLSQSRYVRPVPGERVLKVMRDLGVAENTRFDEQALDSISRRAAAESVLYGQFVEAGGSLRLDLTLRQSTTGVPIPIQVVGSSAEVFRLVDEITSKVKEQLDLTEDQLKADTDRPVSAVTTASLPALRSYQEGLAQLRAGASGQAIPLFRDATATDENFAMAYAKLAEAYLNVGEGHEARSAIERAERLAETQQIPLAERYQIHANAARVRDDFETAAASYEDLAELYPDDPDVQLGLGRALEELGRFPEALLAYRRVTSLVPDSGEGHLSVGWVLVFSGRPDEAVQELEKALDGGVFGDDLEALGNVHSALGQAYRESNALDKAQEHYNLCLDYRRRIGDKRGEAVALARMAPIYIARDDVATAAKVLDEAIGLAREIGDRISESDFLTDKGLVYKVSGDLNRAIEPLRASMRIEAEREDYSRLAMRLNTIAEIYGELGQYDDAIIYLEQARTHLEKTGDIRDKAVNLEHLGLIRKAQGLYDQALEAFLAAQPLFREAGQDWAAAAIFRSTSEIYAAQGRYGDAYRGLQESLKSLEEHHGQAHEFAEVEVLLAELMSTLGRADDAAQALDSAEKRGPAPAEGHHGGGHHESGPSPELLFAKARLASLRGDVKSAGDYFEKANFQANVSKRKAIAVTSRVELGRMFLGQGNPSNAARLLERTIEEARAAQLRPQEAETAALLAEASLARDDADSARRRALEAISIAERFSGRPILVEAYAALARSLEKLDRTSEALDAHAKTASTLEWIRGSLLPEHVDSFMAKPDVQRALAAAVPALEGAGRGADVATLKKWFGASAAAESGS